MEGGEPPDVFSILRTWEEESQNPQYDPVIILDMLAEIIEAETEVYMKMDPDPFDERHPSRAYPSCSLGPTLKHLFRKESFMTKLVNDYLRDNYYSRLGLTNRDVRKLNTAACRLMLDIIPGLDIAAVFEMPTNENLILRLFSWAEKSQEPLQTYSTGLLAAAMEIQEIASCFREQNLRMVPLMLNRLHSLQDEIKEQKKDQLRPFAHLGSAPTSDSIHNSAKRQRRSGSIPNSNEDAVTHVNGIIKPPENDDEGDIKRRRISHEGLMSPPGSYWANSNKHSPPSSSTVNNRHPNNISDCSNSSWAEMESYVIGSVQMFPLTIPTQQMFILRYLTPMGEYQEFLSHIFEKNALDLILQFINLRETKNAKLSFEALKYLASLLCHKKFSIEFINVNGLVRLLDVPRPSKAATGVSICLYYLAYCEDSMERVCLLPHHIVSHLVRYALWLLECSHDSGRCHATMFFGLSFQFKVILDEFDAQDGLRKLYNVISTLAILRSEETPVSEDEECSSRQIVRHVCVTLKRYLEAHLFTKCEEVRRAHLRDLITEPSSFKGHNSHPSYKACKSTDEEVREQINTLLELMSFRAQWAPVDNFNRLGGINLLLRVIAFSYEWNYSGRGETVRCALDVICICAVMHRTQLILCEKVDLPDDQNMVGFNVILGAAEGEIVADPDVQRSALHVIITCVCAPTNRVGGALARYSSAPGSAKKKTLKTSEEVIEKVWECLRNTNGIMVLLNLISIKIPITDADSIRGLACQALCGLSRSDTVRQIIGKLPLFTTGHLQNLMKDPILQDKRQEHVTFQKYALELLERVSGKTKAPVNSEPSLANIHKANVIAQTKIQFNDKELLQLIYSHLMEHGYRESAAFLLKEANLPPPPRPSTIPFTPYNYIDKQSTQPPRSRHSLKAESRSISPPPPVMQTPPCSKNTPLRLSLSSGGKASKLSETNMSRLSCGGRSLEKREDRCIKAIPQPRTRNVTLDSIITEYLTNQHALCNNPMAICPQFTLFQPHKCPDPKLKNKMPTNFTMRFCRGTLSRRYNQRLIHSRFSCVHTFRYGEDNAFFTSCDFLGGDKYIVIGTQHGEVKMFNLQTTNETAAHTCHESYISHIQCSTKNKLLLTSSTWRMPLSACWNLSDNTFTPMFPIEDQEYVEFSKLNEDRVIGTKGEIATIYDIERGVALLSLKPSVSNQYTKNHATFSPTDELVLSDGVLWDVSSSKEIHKFDKLNQTLSGVFHPNGYELVSNTEVWDLRTFHLLRTVPTLDQCEVQFSPTGDIIYSVSLEKETDDDNSYESSFKTLDAYDYSSIATIDVKKNIYDMGCNRKGTQIALVENHGMFESVQESIVKIYDVGRPRNNGEDPTTNEEEDEEEEMDGSDGSNSDDDQHDHSLALDELLDDVSEDGSSASDDLLVFDTISVSLSSSDDDDDDEEDDDGDEDS